MSSSLSTDISQANTKIFEQQQQEIQRRHKEKQRFQACLEKTVKAHYIEQAA